MSNDLVRRSIETVGSTPETVRVVLGRPAPRLLAAGVGVAYLLAYLVAIGDLDVHPGARGVSWLLVDGWTTRMTETAGPYYFEPIAILDLHAITLLLSPGNVAVGGILAVLSGINLALAAVALRNPRACRRPTSGVLGAFVALPGLLSGSACCAPVLLIVLGIPASGLLLSFFGILIPLAVVLLLAGVVLVAREIDVTALATSTARE